MPKDMNTKILGATVVLGYVVVVLGSTVFVNHDSPSVPSMQQPRRRELLLPCAVGCGSPLP